MNRPYVAEMLRRDVHGYSVSAMVCPECELIIEGRLVEVCLDCLTILNDVEDIEDGCLCSNKKWVRCEGELNGKFREVDDA